MLKATAQVQSRELIEELLRKFLVVEGFELLNEKRNNGEQGPAVIAQKNDCTYQFEVIGAKPTGLSRSIDFKVALCQALSRLDGSRNERVVIAMPEVYFLTGMDMRAKRFGFYAWQKLGNVFPLELWFVSQQD